LSWGCYWGKRALRNSGWGREKKKCSKAERRVSRYKGKKCQVVIRGGGGVGTADLLEEKGQFVPTSGGIARGCGG